MIQHSGVPKYHQSGSRVLWGIVCDSRERDRTGFGDALKMINDRTCAEPGQPYGIYEGCE